MSRISRSPSRGRWRPFTVALAILVATLVTSALAWSATVGPTVGLTVRAALFLPSVQVTPRGQTVAAVKQNVATSLTYLVQNGGTATDQFTFRLVCGSPTMTGGCPSAPAPATVPAQGSTTITVPITPTGGGVTGRFTLVARSTADTTVRDSGWVDVTTRAAGFTIGTGFRRKNWMTAPYTSYGTTEPYVKNTGSVSDQYTITLACRPAATFEWCYLPGVTSSYTTAAVSPGSLAQPFLSMRVTAGGSTGQIVYTVQSLADAAVRDSVIYDVFVSNSGVATVAVTPDAGTVDPAATFVLFSIVNAGTANALYDLTAACSWGGVPLACTTDATAVVAAGSYVGAYVQYTPGPPTGTGRIALTATLRGTTTRDSGWVTTSSGATVAVSPTLGSRADLVAARADSVPFVITNGGTTPGSYSLAATCAWNGGSLPCTPASATLTLAAGANATVPVRFTPGAAGTTGQVTLTASLTNGGAPASATGRYDLALGAAPPPAGGAGSGHPLIDRVTRSGDGGATIARDHCVSLPFDAASTFNCTGLQLGHALPAVTTRGQRVQPSLLYTSDHAHPYALVGVDVRIPAGQPLTGTVQVTLQLQGRPSLPAVTRTFNTADWGATGVARRVTLGFDATTQDVPSGVYPYTVTVTRGTLADTTVGQLVIVNRRHTAFGAGWWLAGYEQLVPANPSEPALTDTTSRILWIGGDGSTRLYVRTTPTTWQAERIDRPDSMTATGGAGGGWTRQLPNRGRVVFDAAGRHRSTETVLGTAATFGYAAVSGQPGVQRLTSLTVWQLTSRPYTFVYDANGLVSSIVAQGTGGSTADTRDRATRLAMRLDAPGVGVIDSLVDPDSTAVRFVYHWARPGLIAYRTDRLGVTRTFEYEDNTRILVRSYVDVPRPGQAPERVTWTVVPAELWGLASWSAGPTPLGDARLIIDGPLPALSDQWFVAVDRLDAPTRIENPLGDTTLVAYDPTFVGLPAWTRGATGLVSRSAYNGRGLPDSTWTENVVGTNVAAVMRYTYATADGCPDAVATATGPSGVVSTWTYTTDGTCRVRTAQTGSDTLQRVTYGYVGNGFGAGLVDSVRVALAPAATRYGYDTLGNPTSVTSAAGVATTIQRDALGRDTLTSAPVTLPKVGGGTTSAARQGRSVYDVMDRPRIIRETAPASLAIGGSVTVERTLQTDYDREGRPTVVTRTATPDQTGQGALADTTGYDVLGRVIRHADSYRPGVSEQTTYDAAGNVLTASDRRGNQVTLTYDALSRPLTRTADGQTATYTYGPVTAAGTWLRATNAAGWDSLVYDPAGHLVRHDVTRGGGAMPAVTARLRWTYDRADRAVSRSVILSGGSDSTQVRYAYDPLRGRLDTLVNTAGRATPVYYQPDGALGLLALPNGIDVDYTIGWTGLASGLDYRRRSSGGSLGFGRQYGIDPERGLTRKATPTQALPAADTLLARGFAFDALGRLLAAADSLPGPCTAYFGNPPRDDSLPGEQATGYTCTSNQARGAPYTYQYDGHDMRLPPNASASSASRGHRLLTMPQTGPIGSGTWTYAYDADGNVVSRSGQNMSQTLSWNSLGELNRVTTPSSTVSYAYDALGRRASRSDASGTTYTLWAGDDLAATLSSTGTATALYTFYPGIDQPHSVRLGGTGTAMAYYATDAQGTVVGLMDSTGAPVVRYADGPYGELEGTSSSLGGAPLLRFKARERDAATGLVDLRARWYDPQTGRFLSEDPIGLAGGWNPYTFAGNDPVNYSDPSGLDVEAITGYSWPFSLESLWDVLGLSRRGSGGDWSPGGGGGGSRSSQPPEVVKNLNRVMACNRSASSVMAAVQNNFGDFASYRAPLGAAALAFGPPPNLGVGSSIPITLATVINGTVIPYHTSVTVQSMSPHSLAFATVPGHALYPATITFSASPLGSSQVRFGVDIRGNFANLGWAVGFYAGGSVFEDAVWGNLMTNVGTYCGSNR